MGRGKIVLSVAIVARGGVVRFYVTRCLSYRIFGRPTIEPDKGEVIAVRQIVVFRLLSLGARQLPLSISHPIESEIDWPRNEHERTLAPFNGWNRRKRTG